MITSQKSNVKQWLPVRNQRLNNDYQSEIKGQTINHSQKSKVKQLLPVRNQRLNNYYQSEIKG